MATLKDAIKTAQQEPDSERSTKLMSAIMSGKMDGMASQEGIDLSGFKTHMGTKQQGSLSGMVGNIVNKVAQTPEGQLATAPPPPSMVENVTGMMNKAVENKSELTAPLETTPQLTFEQKVEALKSQGVPADQIDYESLKKPNIAPSELSQGVVKEPSYIDKIGTAFDDKFNKSYDNFMQTVKLEQEGKITSEEAQRMYGRSFISTLINAPSAGLGEAISPVVDPLMEKAVMPVLDTGSNVLEGASEYISPVMIKAFDTLGGEGSFDQFQNQTIEQLDALENKYNSDIEFKTKVDNMLGTAEAGLNLANIIGGVKLAKEAGSVGMKGAELAGQGISKLPEIGANIISKSKSLTDDFLKYAETNAPKVAESLGKAGEVGMDVLKGGAKIGGKIVSVPFKTVGDLKNYLLSQASGLDTATMAFIKKSPQLLDDAQKGIITRETMFKEVNDAIKGQLKNLSSTGKGYEAIRNMNTPINIGEARVGINSLLEKNGLSMSNGKVAELGNLTSSLTETDLGIIGKAVSQLGQMETLTPAQVLNLRSKLDSYIGWDSGVSSQGKNLVKGIRKEVDNVAKESVPALKDLDARYAPEKKALRDLQKDFFNKDGTMKDTAPSKIANLTNKNNVLKLDRLQKVIPDISDKINAVKTLEAIARASENKVGTYARSALLGGGVATMNPVAVGLGLATNPKLVASMLKNKAFVKQFFKSKIGDVKNKLMSGATLSADDKAVTMALLDEIDSKDIVEATKKIPTES